MDLLDQLFELAFQAGCGTSLTSIKRSKRFAVTRRRYEQAPRAYRARGEGNIANLGLWEFASAVATIGETTARAIEPSVRANPADPTVLALLDLLGRQLIRTSRSCLSSAATNLALSWQSLSAAEQLDATFELGKAMKNEFCPSHDDDEPSFSVEGSEIDDWLADSDFLRDTVQRYQLVGSGNQRRLKIWQKGVANEHRLKSSYQPEASLPRAFTSPESTMDPNCLGMAMLLTGFADLTGSSYYVCSYLEHRATAPNLGSVLSVLGDGVMLAELGIPGNSADRTYELEQVQLQLADHFTGTLEDFHYAVIIQLADKTWCLLDPYQSTVVRLDASYDIDGAAAVLECYRDLYPGLTVLATDGGRLNNALKEIEELKREATQHAGSLVMRYREDLISPHWAVMGRDTEEGYRHSYNLHYQRQTPSWLEDYLEDGDAGLWYELLLRRHPTWADYPLEDTTAWYTLSGVSGVVAKVDEATQRHHLTPGQRLELFRICLDSKYDLVDDMTADELLVDVWGAFRALADFGMEPVITEIWSGRSYAHPVIEVMNPGFALALALINQLACWTDSQVDGNVLLDYGSSQQYWHESLGSLSTHACPPPTRIEELVRQLPYHYPIVQNKLDYLSQRRSYGAQSERNSHCRGNESYWPDPRPSASSQSVAG